MNNITSSIVATGIVYVNMEDQLARGIESIIYWLGLDIVTRNIVDRR